MKHLPKIVQRPKKRIGRGHGSGKVKTGGRGTKGQKSRETIQLGFEGGQLSLIKRLPLLRGKGRNKGMGRKNQVISLRTISQFSADSVITLDFLKKHDVIESDAMYVKVLGDGTLTHAYRIELPCSANAQRAIEHAGGTVVAKGS